MKIIEINNDVCWVCSSVLNNEAIDYRCRKIFISCISFSFTRYLRNACREFRQIWHKYPLGQILCFGGQRFSKGHCDLVSVPLSRAPYLRNAWKEGIGFKDDLIREILKLKSSVLLGSTCPILSNFFVCVIEEESSWICTSRFCHHVNRETDIKNIQQWIIKWRQL